MSPKERKQFQNVEICKKSARFGLKVLREPKGSRICKIKRTFSPNLSDFLQISYRLPAGNLKIKKSRK
jgi:hypothetical protein